MATFDEVRLWAIDHGGGVGHVVATTGVWGRYVHTLCERLGNYETTAERPKRVCRACRARLSDLGLWMPLPLPPHEPPERV